MKNMNIVNRSLQPYALSYDRLRLVRDGCVLVGGAGDDADAVSLEGDDDVDEEDLDAVELLLSVEDNPGAPAVSAFVFCAPATAALSLLSFAKNCLAAGGGLLLLSTVELASVASLALNGCCTIEPVRCRLAEFPSKKGC